MANDLTLILISGGFTLLTAIIMRLIDIRARRKEREDAQKREDLLAAYKFFDRIFDSLAPFLYASTTLKAGTNLLMNKELTEKERKEFVGIFKNYYKPAHMALGEIISKGYAAMLPESLYYDILHFSQMIEEGIKILEKDPFLKTATREENLVFQEIPEQCDKIRDKFKRLYRVDKLEL